MKQSLIPIFVSSVHYGLEDLRGALGSFLEDDLGISTVVSFEHSPLGRAGGAGA